MLTIGVGPTFATRWLIPRLAEFQKKEPDIEVRFVTGGATVNYNDEWTCGIRLGNGNWPGFLAERMFTADLTPVCAPAIARRLKQPGDLRNETLLRIAHAPDEWPRWFKLIELSRIRAKGPEFQYYDQALKAAADGVGVAMGISPYMDEDVKAGRLCAPFGRSVLKGDHWYLIYRDTRQNDPGLNAFRAWIMLAAATARASQQIKPAKTGRRGKTRILPRGH